MSVQPIVRTTASSGIAAASASAVESSSISSASSHASWNGSCGGQQMGAQPPQRPALGMPLDDPPAGDDQPGRVEPHRAHRVRRLPHERCRIGTTGTCDVPEVLDRMHVVTLLPCWGALPGDRYHRSEWPRIHRPISCWRHSAPPAGHSGIGSRRSISRRSCSIPYTNESSWILKTAARILEGLRGSDARVNLVVTSDADDARAFLGPYADEFLVFCDPDRATVRALGLSQLPAFVFVRVDGIVGGRGRGLEPGGVEAGGRDDRRRDELADADDPDRLRPGTLPRLTGPRLSVAALADLPVYDSLPAIREALATAGRAVLVAPPGAGKTTIVPLELLDEEWLAGRTDRDARTAPAGHTRGGAADGPPARRGGRRDRRLPDTRRAADRAWNAPRGRHGGRPHATAAERRDVARASGSSCSTRCTSATCRPTSAWRSRSTSPPTSVPICACSRCRQHPTRSDWPRCSVGRR